jgi:hypothetical protein
MIAKGNPHNDGPYLARYLAVASHGNEKAELAELRGFATKNVFDAFALGQLMAEGTQCENPFFHVQVRLPKGEQLTRDQWQKVANRIERRLGFQDQPRAIVFHQKAGQEHMHLVFSRIDASNMHAIDPGLYKRKLKETCRKLEKEMGLQIVKNERDPDEKTQPAARPEYEQSRRLETDLKAIRESIRECWEKSDNGRSFVAALDEKGFVFARGDSRDFVIVDEKGGYHALSKRIIGVTTKQAQGRLADIDKKSLPSVAEARAMQLAKHPHTEDTKAMPDDRAKLEGDERRLPFSPEEEERRQAIAQEEERKREEIGKEDERKQKAIAEEDERRQKAIVNEDQRKQEAIKEAAQKDEEQRRAEFKEQADRQVQQTIDMALQEQRFEAFRAELGRMSEQARREEEVRRRADAEGRAKELAIRDPNSRYGQALAQHYDVKNPYGSLAQSAMAEYGAFLRDRENLNRQIAQAKDPETRRALELRKRIESAEYMAITSDRIAAQSEIIVGRRNTDEAVKQRERAATFRKEAQDLRKEFRELHAGRVLDKETPKVREPQKVVEPQAQKEPEAKRETRPPLMVEERPLSKPRGAPQKLSEFIKDAPTPSKWDQPTRPPDRAMRDPARRAKYEVLVAEQQRGKALDRIGADIKANRSLSADDIRKLSPKDLQNIKEKGAERGDEHLRQIVQEHAKHRAKDRER